MSAEMRYTAFDPEIYLTHRLRRDEQMHFAAVHGYHDDLPVQASGVRITAAELEDSIARTRQLLDAVREDKQH